MVTARKLSFESSSIELDKEFSDEEVGTTKRKTPLKPHCLTFEDLCEMSDLIYQPSQNSIRRQYWSFNLSKLVAKWGGGACGAPSCGLKVCMEWGTYMDWEDLRGFV